jgi:hypothetical protein
VAKVDTYRAYIQEALTRYGSQPSAYADVETQLIFDTERDHYQLVHAGWHRNRRMYGCILHLDIRDGKIWIQHDGTEIGIANELVALGVPKEDIVLAFQAPSKRPYTGFGVA